jgi:hypothetical protein
MHMRPLGDAGICMISLFLLLMPAMILAQSEQSNPGAPPVSQPLINEGGFAVELASALAVANTDDEAESSLGELSALLREMGGLPIIRLHPTSSLNCKIHLLKLLLPASFR